MAEEQNEKALTPKQERFCQEYLVDLNATQAATRAGYSARTANEQGSRLLANASVKARVLELQIERGERVRLDADYVLHNLSVVVERCLERAPVMVREGRELVQDTDADGNHIWKFDSAGANTALGLLGRHLKLFADRVEHSGPNGKPIEHRDLSTASDEQLDAKIAAFLAKQSPKEEG